MREFSSKPPQTEPDDHPLEGVSFSLDGETFTCHPDPESKTFRLAEMARLSRGGDNEAGMALAAEGLLVMLGQAQYNRFVTHIEEHETTDDAVYDIAEWLDSQARERVEAGTGRPTGKSRRSSAGQQTKDERLSILRSLQDGDLAAVPMPAGTTPHPEPVLLEVIPLGQVG
jgi:hypothetical protein